MDLSSLRPAVGANKKRKRLGRGPGSGLGKTSGKGHKGKGSRSGGNTPPGYEGGQMPLSRRLPKRGFRNLFREEYQIVNLGSLERFSTNVVDVAALQSAGLVRGKKKVKILADGDFTKVLTVKAHAFSGKAREKIAALGGTVEVV
ncbi:MAG: 50S ribosomal protein L15 [Deltaproteobacteria bacterium]|nr:50S ribosomal protein L15 [Deltaproteobacteria bacterium]